MVHCRDDVKLSVVDGEPLLILGTAVKGWEIAISPGDAAKFRAALDLYSSDVPMGNSAGSVRWDKNS